MKGRRTSIYSASTTVFVSTLLQWSNTTGELNASVRFNWTYRPLSNLYVVYSRSNETLALPQRFFSQSVVIKITRLFQL